MSRHCQHGVLAKVTSSPTSELVFGGIVWRATKPTLQAHPHAAPLRNPLHPPSPPFIALLSLPLFAQEPASRKQRHNNLPLLAAAAAAAGSKTISHGSKLMMLTQQQPMVLMVSSSSSSRSSQHCHAAPATMQRSRRLAYEVAILHTSLSC